ncbi:MAG: 3-deoxy-7-phosphoheptulonate synthase [Dethiobacteria bacterium]|jgi:3-deoxy-7-phosphoheptulonate synthase
MIIFMQPEALPKEIEVIENYLKELDCHFFTIKNAQKILLSVTGSQTHGAVSTLKLLPGVAKVVPVTSPYKLASKEVQKEKSIIDLGDDLTIGGQDIIVMAGPCAVENEKTLFTVAEKVAAAGAKVLRGGAFKPRTSPYSFQGLEEEGLKLLAAARERTGLKIVTEVVNPQDVELVAAYADILQIGARNMHNYPLLQKIGKQGRPILLKRGLSATVKEWLMAAEYILSGGNFNVILCERGIRTFEDYTRNTLDISAVPLIHDLSHLPIVVDPSHGSGNSKLVPALSRAAIASGADGLLIEVHPQPQNAYCDGDQSLTPQDFHLLMESLPGLARACGRNIGEPQTDLRNRVKHNTTNYAGVSTL